MSKAQTRTNTLNDSIDENVIKKWMHRLAGSKYKPHREKTSRSSVVSPLKNHPEVVRKFKIFKKSSCKTKIYFLYISTAVFSLDFLYWSYFTWHSTAMVRFRIGYWDCRYWSYFSRCAHDAWYKSEKEFLSAL